MKRPPDRIVVRPPDPSAEAWANLFDDRFSDKVGAVDEGKAIPCPVCGEPCDTIGNEAIRIQLQDGWEYYRPGRRFWQHEDKTCVTEWERGRTQDGDVRPF